MPKVYFTASPSQPCSPPLSPLHHNVHSFHEYRLSTATRLLYAEYIASQLHVSRQHFPRTADTIIPIQSHSPHDVCGYMDLLSPSHCAVPFCLLFIEAKLYSTSSSLFFRARVFSRICYFLNIWHISLVADLM